MPLIFKEHQRYVFKKYQGWKIVQLLAIPPTWHQIQDRMDPKHCQVLLKMAPTAGVGRIIPGTPVPTQHPILDPLL